MSSIDTGQADPGRVVGLARLHQLAALPALSLAQAAEAESLAVALGVKVTIRRFDLMAWQSGRPAYTDRVIGGAR